MNDPLGAPVTPAPHRAVFQYTTPPDAGSVKEVVGSCSKCGNHQSFETHVRISLDTLLGMLTSVGYCSECCMRFVTAKPKEHQP